MFFFFIDEGSKRGEMFVLNKLCSAYSAYTFK